MPNSKQKPAPEGTKRSPGKSKFSIPRKEAPSIDGSYLDRLFADYERQTKGAESGSAEIPQIESLTPPVVEELKPEISEEPAAVTPVVESYLPPTTDQPVPSPIEEKGLIETEEPGSHSPEPEAPQPVESAFITETPVHKPPLPVAEPTLIDDQQVVQNLVKLHRLSKGEASVLRVMMRLCQERGSDICYIKIPQLMAITGLKDRQTQRVLKSLSELQIIERLAEYSNADRLGIKYRVIPFHG